MEIGDLLVCHVFHLHSIPRDIKSERGPQFTSRVWQSFCAALVASVSLSSGYHPQSNGQTEMTNQSLESARWCMTAHHPVAWRSRLPWSSTHTTSWCQRHPVCRRLWHCWATNLPCSSIRRRKSWSRPSRRTFVAAGEYGSRCVRLFCALLSRSRGR